MDNDQLEELDEIMEEDEEEVEEKQEPKKSNQKEKPLDSFELCIKEYLDHFAEQDSCFREKYDSSKIRDCVQYIYSEVKKSGRCGFCDDEIFQMARHYFLEEKGLIKCTAPSKVVVNHTVELSEEDKNKAKENALKEDEKENIKDLLKIDENEILELFDSEEFLAYTRDLFSILKAEIGNDKQQMKLFLDYMFYKLRNNSTSFEEYFNKIKVKDDNIFNKNFNNIINNDDYPVILLLISSYLKLGLNTIKNHLYEYQSKM